MHARRAAAAGFRNARASISSRCAGSTKRSWTSLPTISSARPGLNVSAGMSSHILPIQPRARRRRRQELMKRRTEIDATISRLVDAIAAGGECAPLIARIKTSERERVELDRELAALEARAESVVTIETMRKAIDRLLLEWRQALLEAPKNVALARQVVQKLVDRRIEFVPAERDEEAGMLITVPGSLVRPVAIAINRDEATVAQTVDSRPPEQSAGSWSESGSCAQGVASLMPASWNQIVAWLRQIDGFRRAA
jgi:hypothetical protein